MGDMDGIRQFVPREIRLVLSLTANRFGQHGIADPESDLVRLMRPGENDGECRTPASAAKYGDAPHGAFSLFLPNENFGSSPCTNR